MKSFEKRNENRFLVVGHPCIELLIGEESLAASIIDVSLSGIGLVLAEPDKIVLPGRGFIVIDCVSYNVVVVYSAGGRVGAVRQESDLFDIMERHGFRTGFC